MIEEYPLILNDDRTVVLSCDEQYKGNIIIPNGVTCIGDSAFEQCWDIKSITQVSHTYFDGARSIFGLDLSCERQLCVL